MQLRTLRGAFMVLAGVAAVIAALAMIIGGEVTLINATTVFLMIIVISTLAASLRQDTKHLGGGE